MAGKFNLKTLKTKPTDIQKDIANTEKNRVVEAKPLTTTPKIENKEETDEKHTIQTIKRDNTKEKDAAETSIKEKKKPPKEKRPSEDGKTIKVISITLPVDVKNYLRIRPRLLDMTILQFFHDVIEQKQNEYDRQGIDISGTPDYSNIITTKKRSRGENPVIIPIKIEQEQLTWLKRAALFKGMNISQYAEVLLREKMESEA